MFVFFSQNKASYPKAVRKGQLTPFFIVLVVVIIITVLVSVNLSKIALMKTYTANAVDAGALAGASQLSFAFNQIALQASGMYYAYQAYLTAISVMLDEARNALNNVIDLWNIAVGLVASASSVTCIPYVGKYIALALIYAADAIMIVAEFYFNYFYNIVQSINVAVNDMMDDLRSTYKDDIRDSLNENFDNAEDMARDYAFLNSGIDEALNDDLDVSGATRDPNTTPSQADEFSFFVGEEKTPDTFCWRDGQLATNPQSASGLSCQGAPDFSDLQDTGNRLHLARVDVTNTPAPDTFQLLETTYNEDEFDSLFTNIGLLYETIMVLILAAIATTELQVNVLGGPPQCPGYDVWICFTFVCLCILCSWGFTAASIISGIIAVALGQVVFDQFFPYLDEIWTGLQEDNSFCDTDGDVGNRIPITITDLDHVYDQFMVKTYQEHQGQDLGLWNARYPKVKSDARSQYGCNAADCGSPMPLADCGVEGDSCGNICSHTISCVNGKDPCPSHEPSLVAVDEAL